MRQALEANLVPFVLELLDKPLGIDNQPAVKAQLVNALKGTRRLRDTERQGWALTCRPIVCILSHLW